MTDKINQTKVKPEPLAQAGCCGSAAPQTLQEGDIRANVQEFYAGAAQQSDSCCGPKTFYEEDMLDGLPSEIANFSLGCGNPISLAELKPGETIVDLGSGGGLDCFLAAREVGETGHVIGIDMTPEMLEKARAAAAKMNMSQVEFREGYLESLPVDDNSVDVVISNCVINLSPDKSLVFAEVFRSLKPGGRIAVSDIVSNGELPESITKMEHAWASCASGALPKDEYIAGLESAGFTDIELIAKDGEGGILASLPDAPLFSALISARKP